MIIVEKETLRLFWVKFLTGTLAGNIVKKITILATPKLVKGSKTIKGRDQKKKMEMQLFLPAIFPFTLLQLNLTYHITLVSITSKVG